MKIDLIIERGDGEFWGRIESKGNYLPTTVADTIQGVQDNMRMLIDDYAKHEGKDDKFWRKIDVSKLAFTIRYDLHSFLKSMIF